MTKPTGSADRIHVQQHDCFAPSAAVRKSLPLLAPTDYKMHAAKPGLGAPRPPSTRFSPAPHLDVAGVFADVHGLLWVCQHVDLDDVVPIILDVKVQVGEQVVFVLRLTSLRDDLLNLCAAGAHKHKYTPHGSYQLVALLAATHAVHTEVHRHEWHGRMSAAVLGQRSLSCGDETGWAEAHAASGLTNMSVCVCCCCC